MSLRVQTVRRSGRWEWLVRHASCMRFENSLQCSKEDERKPEKSNNTSAEEKERTNANSEESNKSKWKSKNEKSQRRERPKNDAPFCHFHIAVNKSRFATKSTNISSSSRFSNSSRLSLLLFFPYSFRLIRLSWCFFSRFDCVCRLPLINKTLLFLLDGFLRLRKMYEAKKSRRNTLKRNETIFQTHTCWTQTTTIDRFISVPFLLVCRASTSTDDRFQLVFAALKHKHEQHNWTNRLHECDEPNRLLGHRFVSLTRTAVLSA